jgi:hypothetical protein
MRTPHDATHVNPIVQSAAPLRAGCTLHFEDRVTCKPLCNQSASRFAQSDLFQPERSEPYDFTVSFGDPPGLLSAMEREGIPPRMMDVLRGQYRLRGSARPSVLAMVLKETGAKPEMHQ